MFSAVVPAYNAGRFIHDAVSSILSQDLPASEVIVVNDGSSDNTMEVLATFGDKIKVIDIENSGPSTARNLGINAASCEWIAFLDADDRWRQNHLGEIAKVIRRNQSVTMLYTDANMIDEEGRVMKRYSVTRPGDDPFRTFLVTHSIPTPSVVVKKSALIEIGGFLEGLRSGQDWDVWLRLSRAGVVVHVPQITVEVRKNPAGTILSRGLPIRDDSLFVLSRASALDPDLPESLLCRARAQCYMDSAVRMLVALNTAQARRDIFSALKEYQFLPKAWALLMVALGGPGAARAVVAWRKSNK